MALLRNVRARRGLTFSLSALVVLTLFVLSLSVGGDSAAQGNACPDGFVPNESNTGCVSAPAEPGQPDENRTITRSCLQGVLSDDGLTCVVPRLDAAPPPAPAAAAGTATTDAPIPAFTG